MGDETKIDVKNGGTVYQGQPFRWKNTGPNKVTASGLAACCPDDSYDVPAPSGGKEGGKDASILSTAVVGKSYPYTVTDGDKNTQPKLTVDSSVPRPK